MFQPESDKAKLASLCRFCDPFQCNPRAIVFEIGPLRFLGPSSPLPIGGEEQMLPSVGSVVIPTYLE
jgi:hypothetical protein